MLVQRCARCRRRPAAASVLRSIPKGPDTIPEKQHCWQHVHQVVPLREGFQSLTAGPLAVTASPTRASDAVLPALPALPAAVAASRLERINSAFLISLH